MTISPFHTYIYIYMQYITLQEICVQFVFIVFCYGLPTAGFTRILQIYVTSTRTTWFLSESVKNLSSYNIIDDLVQYCSVSITNALELLQCCTQYNKAQQSHVQMLLNTIYRKISIVRRTKFQNSNDTCLVLYLSLPDPLKPGVQSRMKMWLEQRRQAMPQLHLSDQQVYYLLRCALYSRFGGTSLDLWTRLMHHFILLCWFVCPLIALRVIWLMQEFSHDSPRHWMIWKSRSHGSITNNMKVKVVNINAVFRAYYLETKDFHVKKLRNILKPSGILKTYSLCLLRFSLEKN